MKQEKNVIPLTWIDDTERWIVIPGTIREGRKRRIKELLLKKKNCYFAKGVPKSLIDFAYRSVVRLKLSEKVIIFIRGTVRIKRGLIYNAVGIRELDWGVGTLLTIPARMRYRDFLQLKVDGKDFSLRLMELSLLHGLLQVAFPGKSSRYYSEMAAMVLTGGWGMLETEEFPEILRVR